MWGVCGRVKKCVFVVVGPDANGRGREHATAASRQDLQSDGQEPRR